MSDFTIEQVMEKMPAYFVADQAENIHAIIQFHFTGTEESDWAMQIKDGGCKVFPGLSESPNVSMTVDSQDFLDLLEGRLEPMAAFMRGKLQMKGDVTLAMKLPALFKREKG